MKKEIGPPLANSSTLFSCSGIPFSSSTPIFFQGSIRAHMNMLTLLLFSSTGMARYLSESPREARSIATLARAAPPSRASTSTSLLWSPSSSSSSSPSSPFHSTPSRRQHQIEDVVRDPVSPAETSRAASPPSPENDAFLSLPEVRAATRGPLSVYSSRRQAGLYRKDPRQENVMLELQRLFNELEASAAPSTGLTMVEAIGGGKGGGGGGGWLSSLFGSDGGSSSSAPASSSPRGLYMYGGVGTGKTMLMDVFSECTSPLMPVSF